MTSVSPERDILLQLTAEFLRLAVHKHNNPTNAEIKQQVMAHLVERATWPSEAQINAMRVALGMPTDG